MGEGGFEIMQQEQAVSELKIKILLLKERYEQQLEQQQRLIKKFTGSNKHVEGFHVGYYESIIQVIKDLEELLK